MEEVRKLEERTEEIRSRRRKRDMKNRNLLLAVVTVLALFLVLLAFFHDRLFSVKRDTEGTESAQVTVETEQAVYQNTGDIYWNVQTKMAEVYFENQEGNSYNMKYTIALADTGELLYESALLTPGTVLTEIELELPYTEGEYAVTVSADSYDSRTGELLNGVIYTKKIFIIQ